MNNFFYSQTQLHRRKVATMKHLVRCCRLHGTARIRQVLGQMFAFHGRTYKYYDPAADYNQSDPIPEISKAARDTAAILSRAPEGVRRWISQATEDLCDDAKRRIAAEITAHCQDGLNALEVSGLSREAAKHRVLEGLGDPAQANKAFQKTYLTSAQERYMARIFQPRRTHYELLYMALIYATIPAVMGSGVVLARAFGLVDNVTCLGLFSILSFPFSIQLFGVLLGASLRQPTKADMVRERRLRCSLERRSLWLLFAMLACLCMVWEAQVTAFDESLLGWVIPMVPILYTPIHRAIIRSIIGSMQRPARVRQFLMLGYSGMLLVLVLLTVLFYYWCSTLPIIGQHSHSLGALMRNSALCWQAASLVIGLLWFGGHAMIGAFFVSKAKPVETHCPETPLGE